MSKNKACSSIPLDPFASRQEEPQVQYVDVSQEEFADILKLVDDPRVVITRIVGIRNDVLESAYENTKARGGFTQHLVFHGTSEVCADSISKYNFDWRLSGNKVGHKYGHGVNFSPSFRYAAWYSDKSVYERVVLGTKVLIGKSCRGNPNMILPPMGFDTTQSRDGRVIVKYVENEMFPAYKIFYHKHNFNDYYNKTESENFYNDNPQPFHDQYISFSDEQPQNGDFRRGNNFNRNQRFVPYSNGPQNYDFQMGNRNPRFVPNKQNRWQPPVQNHNSFSNNHHNNYYGCDFVNNDDQFVNSNNSYFDDAQFFNGSFDFDDNNNQFLNNNNRFYNNHNRFVGKNNFNYKSRLVNNFNNFGGNFSPFANGGNNFMRYGPDCFLQ